MSKKWFLAVPLAVLIIVGLLILSGFAIHRIGWSEGYRMGQLAASGEGGVTAPYAPFGTVGLVILLLIVIGKVFRFWAWMTWGPWVMAGSSMGAHWARHGVRPHGPVPPWCWSREKPPEETAGPVRSGGGTSAAPLDGDDRPL
jgi:hypothetical protein